MPFAFPLPHLARRLFVLAATGCLLVLSPTWAAAQQEPQFFDTPYANGEWNIGRRVDESQLRYCVDPRDPDWQVDSAIADAIAEALLLEPKRYVVESQLILEDLTNLYEVMLKHCDVHMGFKLIPEGYPSWLTPSRAYYETGYVFVTKNPDIHKLGDLAAGHPIGATVGTTAHIRLVSYLLALPAEKRWPIYPYGTNDLALESLRNRAVDVALVWAPDLWLKQQQDPSFAALHVIEAAPLPPTTLGVGALLLQQNTFLRTTVDQAIAALVSDGTIQSILERYNFPATVKR